MRINKEQESILNEFQCKRVSSIDQSCLHSICGPLVDGVNRSSLVDHFRSPKHLADDKLGALASYVITNNHNEVLLFFSIRCGELFEKIDHQKMILSHNAWVGVNKLKNATSLSPDEQSTAMQAIKNALNAGLSYTDFRFYAKKKRTYIGDVSKEPSKEISRVSIVYSGVELKFLGTNDNAKTFWESLNLPKRMGETLFWFFIVPKLERLREIVGCQYMYLFAADREADGHLVTYYRTVLHIDAPTKLSANKPFFDYNSVFLYQDIETLSKQREQFFDFFNPDIEDTETV